MRHVVSPNLPSYGSIHGWTNIVNPIVDLESKMDCQQGLVNVPIEHHPTIGEIISSRYGKVMFKITKSWDINPNLWPMSGKMKMSDSCANPA